MAHIPFSRDRGDSGLWVEAREIAPLLNGAPAATRAAMEKDPRLAAGCERVPLADYFRLARAHAAASFEESLGMAPRPLVAGTTDFVMAQAPIGGALDEAMRNMAAAYNRLHGGEYNFVDCDAENCVFRVDDRTFPYARAADASVTLMLECVLMSMHGAFCAITGKDLTPALRKVRTRRPARTPHDPLAFWPCAVECGAPVYALHYAPETAALAVRTRPSEAAVHHRVLSLIEKREAALSARSLVAPQVRQALRDGAREQDEVARQLQCSVATLRRRLAQEGVSFRQLRREHLNEAAKLGLLHAERIADVADKLGFSDPRAFTRAFKEWNGQSPQSFRRNPRH